MKSTTKAARKKASLKVELPTELHRSASRRANEGHFNDVAEYIRALIRSDLDRAHEAKEANERLMELIREGQASGEPIEVDDNYIKRLRARSTRVIAEASGRQSPRRRSA